MEDHAIFLDKLKRYLTFSEMSYVEQVAFEHRVVKFTDDVNEDHLNNFLKKIHDFPGGNHFVIVYTKEHQPVRIFDIHENKEITGTFIAQDDE